MEDYGEYLSEQQKRCFKHQGKIVRKYFEVKDRKDKTKNKIALCYAKVRGHRIEKKMVWQIQAGAHDVYCRVHRRIILGILGQGRIRRTRR
jgi:hypothetical protein